MTTSIRHGVPAVRPDEDSLSKFRDGAHKIARLVEQTYGPLGRTVVSSGASGRSSPELLSDGAVIARRMTSLEDRREDMGAMLLRGLLWKLYETTGDGTTTAAIIFDSILSEGIKAQRAGLNTSRLRHFLLTYLEMALESLRHQRIFDPTSQALEGLARSARIDAAIAAEVAGLQATLGTHANIDVRSDQAAKLSHELLDVPFWPTSVLDRALIDAHFGQRIDLALCAVFVSDLDLDTIDLMSSIIDTARTVGSQSLILIGKTISKPCVGLVQMNSSDAFRIVAVRNPETDVIRQRESLDDIATMVGATVFHASTGRSPSGVGVDDLGSARRAWVSQTHVGLFSGSGDAGALQDRMRSITHAFNNTTGPEQAFASLRLARLSGRAGIVRVGGRTSREIDSRKAMAERAIRVMKGAVDGGYVGGGGAALLQVARELRACVIDSSELEAGMANALLIRALERPSWVLACNHGKNPALAVEDAHRAGDGFALNCLSGTVQDVFAEGILDSYDCLALALRSAVEGAAQAMTVDALVFRKAPHVATAP